MLARTFWLCVFLLGVISVMAESNPQQISDEIRAVMSAQETAWNRSDIDGFMNGYARTRDTVFVSGDTLTGAGKQCVIVTRKSTLPRNRWAGSNFQSSKSGSWVLTLRSQSDAGSCNAKAIIHTDDSRLFFVARPRDGGSCTTIPANR